MPDRRPMIPQTNSKSITAKPLACRIFTASTLQHPMLQDLYRMWRSYKCLIHKDLGNGLVEYMTLYVMRANRF
jgi:hypothetical protein